MTTSSTNYYIAPSDGWVQIAPTATKFLRVSGYPHTHPYQLYFGSAAPSLLPTQATGTVTFSGLPTAGQTVTIGSEVYTFRASRSVAFEVTIGADANATAANFATAVNTDSTLVTASASTGTVTLTAIAAGTQGNIALSKTATNVAVSGATLTGGAPIAAGILICHKPFWMNVTTDQPCFARIQNPVPNSNFMDGKIRLDVFSIQ